MASVNIDGGDDKFNRYKMPPVVGKVEGRGNGIKTRIVNCVEVAKALHRPPGYVCKFFGCELGAQTKINDEDGVYIVNGSFNQAKLAEILNLFIKIFVLCGNCKLPETDLKITKKGDIKQLCNACGAETACDMTHKLCTYISNNPPDGKKNKGNKKSKGSKAERRAKKNAKNVETSPSAPVTSSRSVARSTVDGVVEMLPMGAEFDIAAEVDAANENRAAAAAAAANGGSGASGAFSMMMSPEEMYGDDGDDDDGGEWTVDTSKEAQEERLRGLGVNISVLERDTPNEDEAIAVKLKDYMDQGKKASKVIAKAEKLFGEDRVVHGVLAASVVKEPKGNIAKSVEQRAVATLAQFGTPMDSESQMEFLEFLDIYGQNEELRRVLPLILKKGYDGDLLEEEIIFKWHRKPDSNKDVREAVKMIIDWLQKAGEEESDDEDED